MQNFLSTDVYLHSSGHLSFVLWQLGMPELPTVVSLNMGFVPSLCLQETMVHLDPRSPQRLLVYSLRVMNAPFCKLYGQWKR